MFETLLILILVGLSLVFLLAYLLTKKKREFVLSIVPIILISFVNLTIINSNFALFFFIAIIFSFLGDLFMAKWLSITKYRIIDGSIAFGLAHIFYIIGFYRLSNSKILLLPIFTGIIFSLVLYYLIGYNPNLNPIMKISNLIYALIIVLLLTSIIQFIIVKTPQMLTIGLSLGGVILFIISDSVLAYNEFKSKIKFATEVISVTYVFAQILLQLSPIFYSR